MTDSIRQQIAQSGAVADLTGLDVSCIGKISEERTAILVLHVEKFDGVEFHKPMQWTLAADPEDLAAMARQILKALDQT